MAGLTYNTLHSCTACYCIACVCTLGSKDADCPLLFKASLLTCNAGNCTYDIAEASFEICSMIEKPPATSNMLQLLLQLSCCKKPTAFPSAPSHIGNATWLVLYRWMPWGNMSSLEMYALPRRLSPLYQLWHLMCQP